jgi:hypothetical protein
MRFFSSIAWIATLLVSMCLAPAPLGAGQVLGPVAGGMRQLAAPGSDTWLAFPLRDRAVFSARVASVQFGGVGLTGLATVPDGTFSSAANEPRYYAEFVSGNLAGLVCAIITQTGGVLTLDTEGISLLDHPLGAVLVGAGADVIRIRRAWTVESLFEREQVVFSARAYEVQSEGLTLTGLSTVPDDSYSASHGQPRYYAEFVSGNLTGQVYAIVAQSGGALTLDTGGLSLLAHPLGSIAVGAGADVVRIRQASATVLDPVADLPGAIYVAGDALLLPERGVGNVDMPEKARIAYQQGAGWRASDAPTTGAGQRSILPGRVLGVRRNAETELAWTMIGYVPGAAGVSVLPMVAADQERDVALGLMRPTSLTLGDSGLKDVLKLRPADGQPADQVLLRDAASFEVDSPHAIRAERFNAGWQGEAGEVLNQYLLDVDAALVLRIRGTPLTRFWREGGAP